jgi:hypothetical protein
MEYVDKCFKKSRNVVDRLIGDEVVIVPVRSELSVQGTIYNLDPVGAQIWQKIDGTSSVREIREHLVNTMDVSRDQAEKDLIEFLKDLESIGAIEEVDKLEK